MWAMNICSSGTDKKMFSLFITTVAILCSVVYHIALCDEFTLRQRTFVFLQGYNLRLQTNFSLSKSVQYICNK